MSLIWIGLIGTIFFLVMLLTLAICRSAGMADDAMDRLRASDYKGTVSFDRSGTQTEFGNIEENTTTTPLFKHSEVTM